MIHDASNNQTQREWIMIKSHVELAAASDQAVVTKYVKSLGKEDETKHTHKHGNYCCHFLPLPTFYITLVLLPH